MTMSILQQYDDDCLIPTVGFGAKLPETFATCSHCFALNGNIFQPYLHRMKGILDAYNKILPKIVLHGPPAHAPCL